MNQNERDVDGYIQNAVSLIERLTDIYCEYTSETNNETKRDMTRLFKRWFSGFDPSVVQPVHQAFLNEVERIVIELSAVLEQLEIESPESCLTYAEKALDIILAPKPSREKTTTEWYLTVIEHQCMHILPYTSAEKLRDIRSEQIKRTPKRLMLPKQRELFNFIEKLIT